MLRPTYILALVFYCCAAAPAFGQQGVPDKIGGNLDRGPSIPALKTKAEKSAARGDNNSAMHYYRLALKFDSLDAGLLEGFGEAAFNHTRYDSAQWAFQVLLDSFLTNDRGYFMARLADIEYCRGHYGKADTMYQAVTTLKDPSRRAMGAAKTGREKIHWAEHFLDGQKEMAVKRIEDSVSLHRYAEYAPALLDKTLYFTSYRFPLHGDSTNLLMGVLTAEPSGDSLLVRKASFNADNKHTAYATFNHDGTVLYYAVGNYVDDKRIRFELYRRRRTADGAWSSAERLPNSINMPGATNTQPNIGVLPGETNETLFFVSDRPGGKGGKDIWYARIQNDSFSAPINLDQLNTPEDDVSPYFHSATGTLYFSSMGNEKMSLGGFDIFRAKFEGKEWSKTAEPLPPPFNSGANDVFFSMSENGVWRFFASNGQGASNESEEACCYDLYATQCNPEIKIEVCQQENGQPLVETDMRLLEKGPNGLTEISHVPVPGSSHIFSLQAEKEYMLITTKPGFAADTFNFDSNTKAWDCNIEAKRCLRPLRIDLIVTVLEKLSKKPVTGAIVRFYDKSSLGEDGTMKTGPYGAALDSSELVHADDNIYHYDLKFQHDYHLAASKAGYTQDSTAASTVGIQRDTTLRRTLYLERGLSFFAKVFDDISKEPLDSIHFRFMDLTTGKTYEYTTGKDDNNYPDSVIYYNRRYRIVATRDFYSTDSLEFRTDDMHEQAFQRIYKELFLKPKAVELYLPIVLYFDNDQPDCCTLDTTTKLLYVKTYTDYYARKATYLQECCTGVDSVAGRFEMDTFFDNQVKREWLKLFAFQERLHEILESGQHIKITLQGFASPRGHGPYNKNLTSRRVKSVLNQLSKFEGANYFPPYIKSGQLELVEEPYGSSLASKDVPGAAKDKRSIYSVGAAKERKVKIIGVSVAESDLLQFSTEK